LDGNVRWPRHMLPLVSHVKYAPRVALALEKIPDRRTDGRQTVALRLSLDATSVIRFRRVSNKSISWNSVSVIGESSEALAYISVSRSNTTGTSGRIVHRKMSKPIAAGRCLKRGRAR